MTTPREKLRIATARILTAVEKRRAVDVTLADFIEVAELANGIVQAPLGSQVIEKLKRSASVPASADFQYKAVLEPAEAHMLLVALGVESSSGTGGTL